MFYCVLCCYCNAKFLSYRFDSTILEDQYQKSSLSTLKLRFQYALVYTFLNCVTWSIYWVAAGTAHWPACIGATIPLGIGILVALGFSRSEHYKVCDLMFLFDIYFSFFMIYLETLIIP